jgi:hypothetical protein
MPAATHKPLDLFFYTAESAFSILRIQTLGIMLGLDPAPLNFNLDLSLALNPSLALLSIAHIGHADSMVKAIAAIKIDYRVRNSSNVNVRFHQPWCNKNLL